MPFVRAVESIRPNQDEKSIKMMSQRFGGGAAVQKGGARKAGKDKWEEEEVRSWHIFVCFRQYLWFQGPGRYVDVSEKRG